MSDKSNNQTNNSMSVATEKINYNLNATRDITDGTDVILEEDQQRQPFITSPADQSYNRMKYYSALRTGFRQLDPKQQEFLKAPGHVADPFGYYVTQPLQVLQQKVEGQKQSSLTTIFTCWNTMIGSGIVALPWTFGQSGFVLGLIICIVGLAISYRTCILMIRASGNDPEYFDTLYKYWGKWAYYCGFISTLLIMVAAVCAYFVILSQMLYFILLALIEWISGTHIEAITTADFGHFSLTYMALIVFAVEFTITLKKDLTIFIKLMSFGSIFIISLILFIIGFGFYALGTTKFEIIVPSEPAHFNPEDEVRSLRLFNTDFSPLAGLLGIGYFLHTVSLPIIKNNANQKNNERDVFWGYILVGFSYISVGIMGSIGFTGTYFNKYYEKHIDKLQIDQNCMQMFEQTDILAFIMRLALFCLLFCCFPLINHFLRSLVFQLIFRDKEVKQKWFVIINFINLFIPTMITIFYPKVGSILGQIGSIAGLLIVYILPVITYLKKYRLELEHPLLAKAIHSDMYEFRTTGHVDMKSPKIVIRRAVIESQTPNTKRRVQKQIKDQEEQNKVNLRPFYWECFTHSFIILYGVLILILQFYNPFKA